MLPATLHAPEMQSLSEKLCQFPTWVDLKGKDSVPDTVSSGGRRAAGQGEAWEPPPTQPVGGHQEA